MLYARTSVKDLTKCHSHTVQKPGVEKALQECRTHEKGQRLHRTYSTDKRLLERHDPSSLLAREVAARRTRWSRAGCVASASSFAWSMETSAWRSKSLVVRLPHFKHATKGAPKSDLLEFTKKHPRRKGRQPQLTFACVCQTQPQTWQLGWGVGRHLGCPNRAKIARRKMSPKSFNNLRWLVMET